MLSAASSGASLGLIGALFLLLLAAAVVLIVIALIVIRRSGRKIRDAREHDKWREQR